MRDFFQFIFKCMLGFIVMICDSSANPEEEWKFILFGTLGVVVFLLVFFGSYINIFLSERIFLPNMYG